MSGQPKPLFTPRNTDAAYQLHYHFGWYGRGGHPALASAEKRCFIEQAAARVLDDRGAHVLELDVSPQGVRALISLKPEHVPADLTRAVKGSLSAEVRRGLGEQGIWSRGWFLRSVGSVTADVVRRYVAGQFVHHRAAPPGRPEAVALAGYHCGADAGSLRAAAHARFEYNVHVVLVTRRRFDFLDMDLSAQLVEYWRRVCAKHGWLPWDIEVVWDHAHLVLGLRPADSPQAVALSLMNNGAYFLHQRYGTAALRDVHLTGVWREGFYAGTAGSATTAQVKAFLRSQAVGGR
jgi:putative transposase